MHPVIYDFGAITISSFGVMMVIAFLLGNYLLRKDVVAEGYEPIVAEDITFRAAIGGILGAKIYYLIETIPTGQAADNISGLIEIIAGIFTLSGGRIADGIQNFGAGLVFLGGFMGGMAAVSWYVYRNRLNWLKVADWVAPFLILGHGIGRIGCFLVGDDYGIPTHLPWGVSFVNGLPPTTYQSFQFNYPWISLDGFEPGLLTVYPTQLMETVLAVFIFGYLWSRREKIGFEGQLFFTYLVFAGLERFFIEFIRTNIKYISVLTGSQIISIFMILIGVYFLRFNQQVNVPKPSD